MVSIRDRVESRRKKTALTPCVHVMELEYLWYMTREIGSREREYI